MYRRRERQGAEAAVLLEYGEVPTQPHAVGQEPPRWEYRCIDTPWSPHCSPHLVLHVPSPATGAKVFPASVLLQQDSKLHLSWSPFIQAHGKNHSGSEVFDGSQTHTHPCIHSVESQLGNKPRKPRMPSPGSAMRQDAPTSPRHWKPGHPSEKRFGSLHEAPWKCSASLTQ